MRRTESDEPRIILTKPGLSGTIVSNLLLSLVAIVDEILPDKGKAKVFAAFFNQVKYRLKLIFYS